MVILLAAGLCAVFLPLPTVSTRYCGYIAVLLLVPYLLLITMEPMFFIVYNTANVFS